MIGSFTAVGLYAVFSGLTPATGGALAGRRALLIILIIHDCFVTGSLKRPDRAGRLPAAAQTRPKLAPLITAVRPSRSSCRNVGLLWRGGLAAERARP